MLGVFVERGTLAPADLDFSALQGVLPRWRWHESATADQVAERIAGVDVLSAEPPRADNPLLDPEIPQLIVTPHVAWGSRPARQRIVDQLVDNLRAFLAGTPRNVVV